MRNQAARFFVSALVAGIVSLGSICAASSSSQDRPAGGPSRRAEHVVVVVWDGMRPDFVSEQNTPALWKLARSGVTFRNHHAVYPSATIVNGIAINTGDYPNRTGILANHDYRPEIDAKKSIDVENARVVRNGDELSSGNYVTAPTLSEVLQKEGRWTAIAAAKTVGLLFDRHLEGGDSRNVFAGESLPPDAAIEMIRMMGPFPPATQPAERDAWTTKALSDFWWPKEIPPFSLLWLSEPDDTQHRTAPGAPEAMSAVKSSDDKLARVLAALDRHRVRDKTNIFVVSDHGFSTIARSIDVPKILQDARFDAMTEFTNDPRSGQIMVVGNGGTVLFYVIGHDAAVTHRLVEFLQQTDFAGVIFTRQPMEGTFTLGNAKIDNEHAPDVEMAFRWNETKNQFGVAGMIDGDWQRAAGKGTHVTLSKFDMHNTLIAAGPDFRRGETDDLPSGNVDLGPTILAILGIKSPFPMDGRVLSEAMPASKPDAPKAATETIEATKEFPTGKWHQRLQISRVGSTVYFDQGNGGFIR
jgi:predicted AlkP superfamily pyrophosphatase or phosphodiesterase